MSHAFSFAVVNDEDGEHKVAKATFIQPRNFNRWFENFCVDNGFGKYTQDIRSFVRDGKAITRGKGYEGITPHSLRHTQSTLLIGNGVDVKTVQARLGHSSPSLTLKQYTRFMSQNDEAASKLIDRLFDDKLDSGRQ